MAASVACHRLPPGVAAPRLAGRRVLDAHAPRLASRGPAAPAASANSGDSSLTGGSGAGAPRKPGATPTVVPLPGGALWWQNLHSSGTTPLYGSNFVLQRPTVGGPGLVKVARPPAPVRQPPPQPAMLPAVWHAPGSGVGMGLTLAGGSLGAGSVVVDTEYVVLPAAPPPSMLPGDASGAAGGMAPNTSCVGIVWQPRPEAEEEQELQASAARGRRRASGRHPRRTQMLRYTCNLCGEVNDCEVNPHAWAKGSVFARCEGCTAVHKLKDNLRIFHELAGPVFPPPELRSSFLLQEILDRIQENNRN